MSKPQGVLAESAVWCVPAGRHPPHRSQHLLCHCFSLQAPSLLRWSAPAPAPQPAHCCDCMSTSVPRASPHAHRCAVDSIASIQTAQAWCASARAIWASADFAAASDSAAACSSAACCSASSRAAMASARLCSSTLDSSLNSSICRRVNTRCCRLHQDLRMADVALDLLYA
jgi:hypothetical protein